MTKVIGPGRQPSSGAKGLALAVTVLNLTIVVILAANLATAFLISLDGVDADAAVAFLAVMGLLLACTVGGRRGLARHPRLALLVMGVPGALVALLLIASLIFGAVTIGRIQEEMNRTGRPPSFGP